MATGIGDHGMETAAGYGLCPWVAGRAEDRIVSCVHLRVVICKIPVFQTLLWRSLAGASLGRKIRGSFLTRMGQEDAVWLP